MYDDVETSQKGVLVNANANENGNIVERAMARYDIICRKYSQYSNFIGRASANPSNSVNSTLYKTLFGDKALGIALAIVSCVVVAGAIVLITLKKKKGI